MSILPIETLMRLKPNRDIMTAIIYEGIEDG